MKKFNCHSKFLILILLIVMTVIASPAFANPNGLPPGLSKPNVHNTNTNFNTDITTNINANANLNIQDSSQANSQVNSQENSQDNSQSVNVTSTRSRDFVNPGSVGYGALIPAIVADKTTEGVQSLKTMTMYVKIFSEGALQSMLSGSDGCSAEFQVANERVKKAKPDSNGTRWIKVVLQKNPIYGTEFVGYVTSRATSKKSTSVKVMAKAALAAMNHGCNVIQFTAEGAVRDAFATGWGIGFNSTQAFIYNDESRSNVTTGGTGYSSAHATARDLPWLQGFGLVDTSMTYPEE